jgi:hypothetical protein
MKNILFLMVLFLLPYRAFAQGNLQFNQVLYLSANTDNTQQWTVPAGKVWKIEAMGVYNGFINIYFNNSISFVYSGSKTTTSPDAYYRNADAGPIWLPSGTTLGHNCSCGSNRWFSILEFNIVP